MIYRAAPDHWLALRKDNFECLRATGPEGLRDKIRADYSETAVRRFTPDF